MRTVCCTELILKLSIDKYHFWVFNSDLMGVVATLIIRVAVAVIDDNLYLFCPYEMWAVEYISHLEYISHHT